MLQILFYTFSSILLTSALILIIARNPIHSVLFMILVFINVVFILLFLEVEFLVLTFIIVYVGAVAVLFLFVVMMLNIKVTEFSSGIVHYFPIGGFVGFFFLLNILFLLLFSGIFSNSVVFDILNPSYTNWFNEIDFPSNMELLGHLIYTAQLYWFILAGLVLLVAMIGAIVLTSHTREDNIKRQHVFHQLSRDSKKAIFLTNSSYEK